MADDLSIRPFATAAAWESWLEANHGAAPGVWLKIAKKASGVETVTHAQALEVALCFGWIDGQRNRFDETWFLQRFTPRRPRSRWSRINRDKATELTERGLMRPAGLREVELARADGRWDAAYESASRITVPDDLRRALDASPSAAEAFAGLDSANRYAIVYRLGDAKRADTRARRIEKYVAMLERGERLHG